MICNRLHDAAVRIDKHRIRSSVALRCRWLIVSALLSVALVSDKGYLYRDLCISF